MDLYIVLGTVGYLECGICNGISNHFQSFFDHGGVLFNSVLFLDIFTLCLI